MNIFTSRKTLELEAKITELEAELLGLRSFRENRLKYECRLEEMLRERDKELSKLRTRDGDQTRCLQQMQRLIEAWNPPRRLKVYDEE